MVWGERGFKLFPSLPLFFLFLPACTLRGQIFAHSSSSSLSNQVTYIRSIFSLMSDNLKPSQRCFPQCELIHQAVLQREARVDELSSDLVKCRLSHSGKGECWTSCLLTSKISPAGAKTCNTNGNVDIV